MLIIKQERINLIKNCLDNLLDVRVCCDAQEEIYRRVVKFVYAVCDEITKAEDDEENEFISNLFDSFSKIKKHNQDYK